MPPLSAVRKLEPLWVAGTQSAWEVTVLPPHSVVVFVSSNSPVLCLVYVFEMCVTPPQRALQILLKKNNKTVHSLCRITSSVRSGYTILYDLKQGNEEAICPIITYYILDLV